MSAVLSIQHKNTVTSLQYKLANAGGENGYQNLLRAVAQILWGVTIMSLYVCNTA